jgi:hypothetical protein
MPPGQAESGKAMPVNQLYGWQLCRFFKIHMRMLNTSRGEYKKYNKYPIDWHIPFVRTAKNLEIQQFCMYVILYMQIMQEPVVWRLWRVYISHPASGSEASPMPAPRHERSACRPANFSGWGTGPARFCFCHPAGMGSGQPAAPGLHR